MDKVGKSINLTNPLRSFLVLCRRIMLCNLGSFQATTIAIIITGIEETLFRATIEQRDVWYHEMYLNKPALTAEELKKNLDKALRLCHKHGAMFDRWPLIKESIDLKVFFFRFPLADDQAKKLGNCGACTPMG